VRTLHFPAAVTVTALYMNPATQPPLEMLLWTRRTASAQAAPCSPFDGVMWIAYIRLELTQGFPTLWPHAIMPSREASVRGTGREREDTQTR
jgi:hypothetical protein